MALLTLAELIDECQDVKATLPQAKIVRAANKVIRRIHAETTIPQYSTFTTRAKVTTGTVSVTQDSTTATFSSAVLATSDPIDLVQIEGETAWFLVTPGSTTVGTLSSMWPAATDATATYTLVRPTVSFPRAVAEILRIWRPGLEDLDYAPDRGGDEVERLASVTGTPVRWSPYIHDAATASPNDDLLRIILDPAPESRETWMYSYRSRPALLTPGGATTQTIPLPDVWNEAVIAGTLCGAYEVRDGLAAAGAKRSEYEAIVKRIKGSLLPAAVVKPGVHRRNLTAYSPRPTES